MKALLELLLDKSGINVAFKLLMFGVFITFLTIVWSEFLTYLAGQITSIQNLGTYSGLSVNILSSLLPANTTTLIGLTLSTDLAIIAFRRTMMILSIKKDFVTGN